MSFFFNDTATTEIYTLSLHDALPILPGHAVGVNTGYVMTQNPNQAYDIIGATKTGITIDARGKPHDENSPNHEDRKSTRLNSSHSQTSYAVFCLKTNIVSCSPPPSTA